MIQVQFGDIVLVHSHNFTARGIQFFMNVNRWLHLDFKPFYNERISNHVGMGEENNCLIDSPSEGVKIRPINEVYQPGCNKIITVYRPKWTMEQKSILKAVYNELNGKPYQFTNFLIWPIYILTFGLLWIGRRGAAASKEIYCSEFAATCIFYATNKSFSKEDEQPNKLFKKFWKISPSQIETFCKEHYQLIDTYIL